MSRLTLFLAGLPWALSILLGPLPGFQLHAQEVEGLGVVELDPLRPGGCASPVRAFALGLAPAQDLPVLCPPPREEEAHLLKQEETPGFLHLPDWGGRLGIRLEEDRELLGPGTSRWTDGLGWVYPGPEALELPGGGVTLDTWGSSDRFAFMIRAVMRSHRPLQGSHASARFGPVRLWGGSRPVVYSWGRWGSAVLSGSLPLPLVGLETLSNLSLPWIFRALGPTKVFLFLGPHSRSGSVRSPLFAGARVQFAPSPGIVIGANRALIFGGEGNQESITAGNVLLALFGFTSQLGKSSDFENQVASLDAMVRLHLDGRHAVVYGEWAADDSGLAFLVSPGLRLGFEAHELSGRWWGAEGVLFAKRRGERPPWYQHGGLGGGWSRRGMLLGHPLGGHGAQILVGSGMQVATGGGEAWVGLRERGSGNLLSPDREGNAVFGGGSLRHRLTPWAGFRVEGEGEAGKGWRSGLVRLEVWIQGPG